jgi:hemoglobin-like flavoprotein
VNSHQISLVRASWAAASARADVLTSTFYAYLFEIDRSAAALFAGVDMAAQQKKLAQSLAVVVNAADDPGRLVPALTALGQRHARYRVEQRHFDSVGTALLRALGHTLGAAFTADVRDAWAAAYGAVASLMRDAMVRAGEGEKAA